MPRNKAYIKVIRPGIFWLKSYDWQRDFFCRFWTYAWSLANRKKAKFEITCDKYARKEA